MDDEKLESPNDARTKDERTVNVADRLNFIVVAPTGGVGRWTIDETTTRVPAALTEAKRVVAIDSGQIHAIGLSNGGRAVSQLLAGSKGDYRSFVFLSPVFREESVRTLANATVNALSQVHVSGKSFNAHPSPFN